MKIIEFDMPKWIIPKSPYWVKESGFVIFISNKTLPNRGYYRPDYYTRVVLYDYNDDVIKNTLRDFLVFSEFLYRDNLMHKWFGTFPFSRPYLDKYEKEIENLEDYIISESANYDAYLHVHEFEKHPLLEISPEQNKINFNKYFNLYREVGNENKIRQLIDFFVANSISQSTLINVFDNSNLYINNYFILIEALINLEIKDQSGIRKCEKCGHEVPAKRKMTELIEIFAEKQDNYNDEDRKLLRDILLAHYRLRNAFAHSAKYGNALEKLKEAMAKLDQKGLSIQEEVKYADASMMGVNAIDAFLRIKLLSMLETHKIQSIQ